MRVKGTKQLGLSKKGIDLSPIPEIINRKNKLIPQVTAPSAPIINYITIPEGGMLFVYFTPPQNDGGATITNYQYSIDGGTTWVTRSPVSASTPLVITGLTNGTTYQVQIRAVNSAGSGVSSNIVSATPITTPSAPNITNIQNGNAQVSVVFTPPQNDGGATITNYQYSIDGGTTWVTRSPVSASTPLVITGLTNGAQYFIRIRAVNSAGVGIASDVQVGLPVAPAPSAPTITSLTNITSNSVTVNFTPPSSDAGTAITNYQYSVFGGYDGFTFLNPASISSPFTLTNLQPGQYYGIVIRAYNGIPGSISNTVYFTAPTTTPSAPTIVNIVPSSTTLTVNFNNPPSNGGSTITNYQYSIDGGTTWVTRSPVSASTPLVITGLTNATTYQVQIRAVNSVGSGASSSTVSATTSSGATLTVNHSDGSLFSEYFTNNITVANMGGANPVGLNGGSSVTSLTFSSCGYYGFSLNSTSSLTSLTSLTFSSCGYYGFNINNTAFFTNLTSLAFTDCGLQGGFNIQDSTTTLQESKALLVLNSVNNGTNLGIGTITLKVTGTSTLQTVKNSLINKGFSVSLIT